MLNKEKVVLITGVSGVVGQAIANGLLSDGNRVIGLYKSKESAENLKELKKKYKNQLKIHQCNITNISEIKLLINELMNNELWIPNALINNARSISSLSLDEKGRPEGENFLEEFNLSIISHYNLTMELLDSNNSEIDRVINIGSIYGSVIPKKRIYENFLTDSPIHYGIVKSSMIHLTKELAVRLAERKILVNCVSYGGIKGRASDEFIKKYEDICPLGEMLDLADIYPPIGFFISDSIKNITGQNLIVDGGFSLQ